jgi:phosphonate transport system substrate-binding protein
MLRKFLACTIVTLTASGLAAHAQTPTELNFGIISTEASVNQKKIWEPFLAVMAKQTGYKINGFYATDYAGVIEAMRFNKVQVAWYGNKSGMEAVDRSSGQVFAQVLATNGSLGYYSHIIVNKDSPYNTLDDILKCDKTLDFGRTRPRASWCRLPTSSPPRASIPRPASRPCATPTIRPMPWRSPTSRWRRRPTTARTCSASP